jgi:hypothetical protein
MALTLSISLPLQSSEPRQALFGDLHLHTSWSFDSYIFGSDNDPRDAYDFAQGKTVTIAGDQNLKHKLKVPLDFAAITDHAESFGYTDRCLINEQSPYFTSKGCERFRSRDLSFYFEGFKSVAENPPRHIDSICDDNKSCRESAKTLWQQTQDIANEYNQPGKFTTFKAYEYSGNLTRGGMLHRNVIFAGDKVPSEAMSAFDLYTARELWQWLEESCTDDCDVITIPHNSNISWGHTFALQNSDGSKWTPEDYRRREKLDRLAEIHQAKGNSECYQGIGTADEFCNFELFLKECEEGQTTRCMNENSFVRNALKTGLKLDSELGFNPYSYGIIGSTDSHNGNPGGTQEDEYPGHHAGVESTIKKRLTGGHRVKEGRGSVTYNPGGLAGVWAEENTRESIFAALKRKETFGTSGNRIRVRMFAGWDFASDLHQSNDWDTTSYKTGVPMGSVLTLTNDQQVPSLLVWAGRDANGAPLERLQIIKGWIDENGDTQELTYDVACSDGLSPDTSAHRCPSNNAPIDTNTCVIDESTGDAQLSAVWKDPDFHPQQKAFYYARVLENPTCRWSTYDMNASNRNIQPANPVPETVQERAWGSPIWVK